MDYAELAETAARNRHVEAEKKIKEERERIDKKIERMQRTYRERMARYRVNEERVLRENWLVEGGYLLDKRYGDFYAFGPARGFFRRRKKLGVTSDFGYDLFDPTRDKRARRL